MGTVGAMVALILALACPRESAFDTALAAVRGGDRAGTEAIVAAEGDPIARDMLRVGLATEEPVRGAWLCDAVTTPLAKVKCTNVRGRPHLGGAPP